MSTVCGEFQNCRFRNQGQKDYNVKLITANESRHDCETLSCLAGRNNRIEATNQIFEPFPQPKRKIQRVMRPVILQDKRSKFRRGETADRPQ